MGLQEVGDAMTASVQRKECFVCGGNLIKEENSPNYICESTGMYAWGCSCGAGFHLSESYPTRRAESCPECGSEHLMQAHK